MRVLLGFIEAKCVVLDALIRSEGSLYYLSVLCSSKAGPADFSAIMKRTAPRAVIEEIDRRYAEARMSSQIIERGYTGVIPFSKPVQTLIESRKVLLSLLLEYRALLAECNSIVAGPGSSRIDSRSSYYTVPFLFFGKDEQRYAIPEFQVEHISPGVNGSYLIEPYHLYGKRILVCDELLSTREVNIPTCSFGAKTGKGMYSVTARSGEDLVSFILVVPSFL